MRCRKLCFPIFLDTRSCSNKCETKIDFKICNKKDKESKINNLKFILYIQNHAQGLKIRQRDLSFR